MKSKNIRSEQAAELCVHQIEEMQNEELRQSQSELDAARKRYFDMYDLAPVGYCTLSEKGLILEANLTAATLLGITRSALIKQPISRFIHKEDQDIYYLHCKQLFETVEPQACELRMVKKVRAQFWARFESNVVRNVNGNPLIRVVISDITKYKKAEEALVEREQYLQTILQTTADGFWVIDAEGKITEANEAYCRMSGYARDELLKLGISDIDAAEKPAETAARIRRVIANGSEIFETRHFRKDGSVFDVEISSTYMHMNGGNFVSFCRDITERKQLEDAQSFLLQCGSTDSGDGFFNSLSRYLSQSLNMDYVCIDRLEGEGLSARTVSIYFDGKFEDNVSYTLKDTPCGDVVGKEICCFDREVRHLFPQDVVLQEMMAESYVGATLWSFDGKPIGLIAVIGRRPLENTRLAESMLKMAAVRAAGELERQQAIDAIMENDKKLQKSHEVLEDRVKERTQALSLNYELLQKEIEDRLQAEQALQESEEKYRSIFHNRHANMLLIDPETLNIIDANPAACSFYGYARDEMTTKKLTDFSMLTPDMIFQKITLILSNQKEHFFFSHRKSNGQIREVEVFVCTVRIKGKIFLFSIGHDITEHRRAEQRIVEVSEFIQKIFDASPFGILVYDAAGQCVMANEAVGGIIGASREAVLRQNLNHLDSWKRSGLLTAAQEVIQTNQPRENLEFQFVTTFGRDVTLKGCLIPFSSDSKPHLLLIGQDISRQKQADEALRQSQKLASIGLLVAGIAHEINNPNGFIIFNLPILRDYLQELMPIVDDYMGDHPNRNVFGRLYEDFRKDLFKLLDNIEHGAQRINSTVSGLINFSRNREKLELRPVALKPVIDHAVSMCRGEIRENVKSLHLVIPENLPPVRTDPEAIEQVLVNLLINAAHASDKEDSWIRLCVSIDDGKPERCTIVIEDNGCGMDEKTMKRIFDPFYTRKTSVQGTGLGLYICQSLVEGLGGRIEVASQPDQGSSFKVILSSGYDEAQG